MDGYRQTSYGSAKGAKLEPYPADWSFEPDRNHPVDVPRPAGYPESYVVKNETYMEVVEPHVVSKQEYGSIVGHGRTISPAYDRRAHDSPTHIRPSHDRPAHGSPTHVRRDHDSPTHNRPGHDGLTHDRVTQYSPTRSHLTNTRPAHDSPTHSRPSHDRPTHDYTSHSGPTTTHNRPGHDGLTHDRVGHYSPTRSHLTNTRPAHDSPTHGRLSHDRPPEIIDKIQTEVSRPTLFPADRTRSQEPHLTSQTSMNRPSRFIIPLRGGKDEPTNPRSYDPSQRTRFHNPPQTESWFDDRQPTRFPDPSLTDGWRQDSYNPNLAAHVGSPGRSQTGGLQAYPQTQPWHQDPHLVRNNSWPRSGTNGAVGTKPTNQFQRPADTRLSKPTNDIETALNFLKVATGGLEDSKTNVSKAPPTQTMVKETYGSVIDSREAAKRYNGALV